MTRLCARFDEKPPRKRDLLGVDERGRMPDAAASPSAASSGVVALNGSAMRGS